MAKIERFEELKSWQKGRELCRVVYRVTRDGPFRKDFGLRDQMRRAVVSVMSNIAEGFESQNNRTFVRFLYIAKGSVGEVRAQAYVALDQDYITQAEFDEITVLSKEISRLLSKFITYLKNHLDRQR